MKQKIILLSLTMLVLGIASIVVIFRPRGSTPGRVGLDSQPPSRATTRIGAMVNLPRLTNDAGLIVVGRVVDLKAVTLQASNDGKAYVAELLVTRVLKGSIRTSTITINFIRSADRAGGSKSISPSLFAMFFLKEESPRSYTLADSEVEAVIAAEGAPVLQGGAVEQVINELGNVLVSSASSQSDQLQAIAAIISFDSPTVIEILHKALGSKDVKVRFQAQAGLLRHNDISVLDEAEHALLKPPADVPESTVILSSAIEDGVRDPKAIPTLARLLSASDPRVRRAAAHALRGTQAVDAIHPLSMGLNDSDQMVRYDAVAGLAEITSDFSHAPSVELFKRDEITYLKYWRERTK
jgi:HEAT repeats